MRSTIRTTESITGTSTNTPTTVASAAPDYAAQGKAVVSAAFGRPSGEMAERATTQWAAALGATAAAHC